MKWIRKGSAIKKAMEYVTGDYVLIQDADLEYDPKDYYKLIDPIKSLTQMWYMVHDSKDPKPKEFYISKIELLIIFWVFG